jgi:hypothetical protein
LPEESVGRVLKWTFEALQMSMQYGKAKVLVWGSAIGLSAIMVLMIGPPLLKVWHCYHLANSAEREIASVVGKHESVGLVFGFGSEHIPTDSCTAEVSKSVFEAAQIGGTFEVVRKPGRPDQCYLTSSLALSGLILAGLSGLTLIVLALILGFAWFAQRSFASAMTLTSEVDEAELGGVSCCGCFATMEPGYIVPFGGIHWRDADQPIGLPTALGGLPGTVGWRGRPRLQAFRCEVCGIVTFKHLTPALVAQPSGIVG